MIKRILELTGGKKSMSKVYYEENDIFTGLPSHFKGNTIGYLIDLYPFEIEKFKSEKRFYLSDNLRDRLRQSMEIARKPKQKNKNQMELF